LLTELSSLVRTATDALEGYEYTRALDRTETFFWSFCDDYLELVKSRRYGDQGPEGAQSANAAMQVTLSALLRLFAPYVPFVAEEAWSWWHTGSVHQAAWPEAGEIDALIGAGPATTGVLAVAVEVLASVRRAKSEAKVGLKAAVAAAEVRDTPERLAALALVEADVRAAGNIQTLPVAPAEAFTVTVTFAPAGSGGERA
jgi:valyl-tRNA synthetase